MRTSGHRCPMLFCQGTKDPFATPELLEAVVASLPTAEHHRIGAVTTRSGFGAEAQDDVVVELIDAITAFVRSTFTTPCLY